MKARILAVVLLLMFAVPMPVQGVGENGGGGQSCDIANPQQTPTALGGTEFTDRCYHQGVWYSPVTSEYDVLIVPPASPYFLRDIELVEGSVDMWEESIKRMGAPWLAEGLHINDYTLGLEDVPLDALQDPEVIVLLSTEFHAVAVGGLFGVAVLQPNGVCADLVQAWQDGTWLDLPGFHHHPGSSFGSYLTRANDCGGTLGTQRQCWVVNLNFPFAPGLVSDNDRRRTMFDLISHEVGHCLTLGHVGDADTEETDNSLAYPEHDILSYESDDLVERDASGTSVTHCPSNLNIRTIERAFGWLLGQGNNRAIAPQAGSYTHMDPDEWHTDPECTRADADYADPSYLLGRGVLQPDQDADVGGGGSTPTITITSPAPLASVAPGPLEVAGSVDRAAGGGGGELSVDGGGPYVGAAGAPVAVASFVNGGRPPYQCSWSGEGATFGDANACATTATFDEVGAYTIRVDVTDDVEATAFDEASVTIHAEGGGTDLYLTTSRSDLSTAADCSSRYRYDLSPAIPAPGKAYAGAEFAPLNCPGDEFVGAFSQAVDLTAVSFDLWWACDVPTYMMPNGPGLLPWFLVSLFREDGTQVGQDTFYYDADSTGIICDTDARQSTVTVMGSGTAAADEQLRAVVIPFVMNPGTNHPTGPNFHYLVGGSQATRMSASAAAGGAGDMASWMQISADSVSDPEGDFSQPHMDIIALRIEGVDDDSFDVVMQVQDLDGGPQSTPVLQFNYGVDFCVDNNFFADEPVCYRYSAQNTMTGPVFAGGVINENGSSCGYADLIEGGEIDVEANTLRWTIPKATLDFTDPPADINDCVDTAPPAPPETWARGGAPVADGTQMTGLRGTTGVRVSAVAASITFGHDGLLTGAQDDGVFGDGTDEGSYTFGDAQGLLVDAGGPYSGRVGEAITVTASISGGAGGAACLWSGGDFAEPDACSTTVSFPTVGARTISVAVSEDGFDNAADSATVTVSDAATDERVDLWVGDQKHDSIPTGTSGANPTAPFAGEVDLTGLSGQQTITAIWYGADGSELDRDSVEVDIESATAVVNFTQPTEGAQLPVGDFTFQGTVSPGGQSGSAPNAAVTPAQQSGDVGEVLAFTGMVAGEPQPTCTWTFDGSPAGASFASATTECTGASVTSTTSQQVTVRLTASNAHGSGSATATAAWTEPGTHSITIEQPAGEATITQMPFTVSGTATGTADGSWQPSATTISSIGFLPEATRSAAGLFWSPEVQAIEDALSYAPGFLGVVPNTWAGAPAIDVYFSGAAPKVDAVADVPIAVHEHTAQRQLVQRHGDDVMEHINFVQANYDPLLPDVGMWSVGIGPGSPLLMEIRNAPNPDDNGFYGCTANFVWKDQRGDIHLGAAGHCFLAPGITGGKTAGGTWDESANVDVSVCVSDCITGGAMGGLEDIFLGNYVALGKVTYARQSILSQATGNDFGLVAVPQELHAHLRTAIPFWNGPLAQDDNPAQGKGTVIHGNSVAYGETFAGKNRFGVSLGESLRAPANTVQNIIWGNGGGYWTAIMPGEMGDSGSAVNTIRMAEGANPPTPNGNTWLDEGDGAGILTHGIGPWNVLTKMDRAQQMATEARLCIAMVPAGVEPSAFPAPAATEDCATEASVPTAAIIEATQSAGIGQPLSFNAIVTGEPAPNCVWDVSGDAELVADGCLSATVTSSAVGSQTVTLTATNAFGSAGDAATATWTDGSAVTYDVQYSAGGEFVSVDSFDPQTGAWSASLDGLPNEPTTINVQLVGGAGVLAADSVDVMINVQTTGGCGALEGTLIHTDAPDDGGGAGGASELLCLSGHYDADAGTVKLQLEVEDANDVQAGADTFYYDFWFTPSWTNAQVWTYFTWDGSTGGTIFWSDDADPASPIKDLTGAYGGTVTKVGNVVVLEFPVSNFASPPPDGATLGSMVAGADTWDGALSTWHDCTEGPTASCTGTGTLSLGVTGGGGPGGCIDDPLDAPVDPAAANPWEITKVCAERTQTELIITATISGMSTQDTVGAVGSPVVYTFGTSEGQYVDTWRNLDGWVVFDWGNGDAPGASVTQVGDTLTVRIPVTEVFGAPGGAWVGSSVGDPLLGFTPNFIGSVIDESELFFVDRAPDSGGAAIQSSAWVHWVSSMANGPAEDAPGEHVALYRDGVLVGFYEFEGPVEATTPWSIEGHIVAGPQTLAAEWYDASGLLLAATTIQVQGGEGNQPPMVDAGPDQSVTAGDFVQLAGSCVDPDGSIATCAWSHVSGPSVTITDNGNGTGSFTAPDVTEEVAIVLRLTATDDGGATAGGDVQIAVEPIPNDPPVTDAGPDQTVSVGDQVQLQGSCSDTDDNLDSCLWSQLSGPTVSIDDRGNGTGTFEASQPGVVELRLMGTDDRGATAFDDMQVTVKAPPSTITIDDPADGSEVSSAFTVSGTAFVSEGAGSGMAMSSMSMPSQPEADALAAAEWTRAVYMVPDDVAVPAPRSHDQVPMLDASPGIGPGAAILVRSPAESTSRGLCTANFIWQTGSGDEMRLFLGAAGHCFFLSNPTTGATLYDTTHGQGRKHPGPERVMTQVCIRDCFTGGLSTVNFKPTGEWVNLGHLVYARQSTPNDAIRVGNDFGIVEIPPALWHLVSPGMPTWGGPFGEGTGTSGAFTVHYGNAVGLGETLPTKARAGISANEGFPQPGSWVAAHPAAQGDSGSAVNLGIVDAQGVLRGTQALGVLTHLSAGNSGSPYITAGTTTEKARTMAAEAGLAITMVNEGATFTQGGSAGLPTAWDGHEETWYLHRTGAACAAGNALFMDQRDTAGDLHGCGSIGLASAFGSAPFGAYPAVADGTAGFPALSRVDASMFLTANNPAPMTARTVLMADGFPVGDGEATAVFVPGAGYQRYDISFLTHHEIPAGAALALELYVHGSPSAFVGYEGTDASRFVIRAASDGAGVQLRALSGEDEVLTWTSVDAFDGSQWSHNVALPDGTYRIQARVFADGATQAIDEITVHVAAVPQPPCPDMPGLADACAETGVGRLAAKIEPRNAFRTDAASIVEADLGNHFVFDVELVAADGAPWPITEWRLEVEALNPEGAARRSIGSYGERDVDRPAHDGAGRLVVAVPAADLLANGPGSLVDRLVRVSLHVMVGDVEYSMQYSELANDLLSTGAPTHAVDDGHFTPVRLEARRASVAPLQDATLDVIVAGL